MSEQQPHGTVGERIWAALCYLGPFSLFAMLFSRRPFNLFHARQGFTIFLLRLFVILLIAILPPILFLPEMHNPGLSVSEVTQAILTSMTKSFSSSSTDFALLIVTGFANPSGFFSLPLWPILIMFTATVFDIWGGIVALNGSYSPLLFVSWLSGAEPPRHQLSNQKRSPLSERSLQDERARQRRIYEERLERMRSALLAAENERRRKDRLNELKKGLRDNLIKLEQLDESLSFGEISKSRYDKLKSLFEDEILKTIEEAKTLGENIEMLATRQPRTNVNSFDSMLEPSVLSISIFDKAGVPILTYGHFELDESLVSGMLSAFNSVSEEVFGSPIRKTSLTGGQVIYFLHEEYTILVSVFSDEPSSRQVRQIREKLAEFELVNRHELQKSSADPSKLLPLAIDLSFKE